MSSRSSPVSSSLYGSMNLVRQKIQFAGGIGQRDTLLRADTLPSITRAKIGCFARLGLSEESARFLLLSVIILLYLTFGAVLFSQLEFENEISERKEYSLLLASVKKAICQDEDLCEALDRLLELRSNLTVAGLTRQEDRFDIPGAFFFAGTVISTIGFGMTTPQTTAGRMVTILYGFVGCTCCVLFFNLFLERLITGLTYVLRYSHERKLRKRQSDSATPIALYVNDMGESSTSLDRFDDNWRPSVYKVFLMVLVLCVIIMLIAARFYSVTEGWYFLDALYFCFIGFGTIGFGDFVPNQRPQYEYPRSLIRIANFVILSLGASSVYCLFNVSSMVVRQFLNWLIKRMDVKISDSHRFFCLKRKRKRYMGLGLRPPPGYDPSANSSFSGDGLLSLKEFLMNNQSSLLNIQRHLIQSPTRKVENTEKISASRVGPMGLLTAKFGDG